MELSVLIENETRDPGLYAEHGLSLLIRTQGTTILFDTGQSGAFADNARAMGVDLRRVDLAILSHGHYDHGGGIPRFLRENDHAPVYVTPGAFGWHYSNPDKYNGLDRNLEGNPRLKLAGDPMTLGPGLTLLTCAGREKVCDLGNFGLLQLVDGEFYPDDFAHEQYLLVEEAGRRILISGCSHKGIVNLMSWLRPDVCVGGFHFKKLDPDRDRALLEEQGRTLASFGAQYYTCHCTGAAQCRVLRPVMGNFFHEIHTGDIITI